MNDSKKVFAASLGLALAIFIPLVTLVYQRSKKQKNLTIKKVLTFHSSDDLQNGRVDDLSCSSCDSEQDTEEEPAPSITAAVMPVLFELPDSVLREVFFSWLTLKDLPQLDKAVCNQRARPQLHAVFASPKLLQHVSQDKQRSLDRVKCLLPMYRWADKRALRFDGLVLSSIAAVNIAKNILFGDHVEWIYFEVSGFHANHCFAQALPACPNLRELTVRAPLIQSSVVVIAENCFLLTHLDVSEYAQSMEDAAFLRLCRGCPELTTLRMGRSECVSERGLLEGLAQLPKLTDLRHFPTQPLSDAALVSIGRSCPLLENVHTTLPSNGLTDAYALHFARQFPRLVSFGQLLRMGLFHPLSRAAYLELFAACPRINTWEFSKEFDLDIADAVLAVHSQQLTDLSVNITWSAEILGVIARRCPHLQQLTVRVEEGDQGPTPRELDGALLTISHTCPSLHTIVFVTSKTMTADGLLRFTLRCPSLRRVVLQRSSPELKFAQRTRLTRLVPGLTFVTAKSSKPKYY